MATKKATFVVSPSESSVVSRLRAAGCVFAEDEARLLISAAYTPAALESMLAQRVEGLPLEHILGWVEFCGLRVSVDTGVFVPRRRTEFLVGQAARLAHPGDVVVDLCCGSGALGAALSAMVDGLEVHAADIDPVAVRCARRNIDADHVYEGDLYEPLPENIRGRIDILVANAPYVPSEAIALMPPEARVHEPQIALDGGPDGMTVARRVVAQARTWLAIGGHLLIETSEEQAPHVAEATASAGLIGRVVSDDERQATAVIATRSHV